MPSDSENIAQSASNGHRSDGEADWLLSKRIPVAAPCLKVSFPEILELPFCEAVTQSALTLRDRATGEFWSGTENTAGDSPGQPGMADLLNDIRQLLGQLSAIQTLGRCPVVAITGLLNAGKSSLLSSFLSPAGRHRVLIGTSNHAGTHRFVIWLPSAWQSDQVVWSQLCSHITSIFGTAPELLDSDPEVAFRQYNGEVINSSCASDISDIMTTRKAMAAIQIPLLATDSGLDQLELGLLDCPDIQTGSIDSEVWSSGLPEETDNLDIPEMRRQMLSKASRLASAFLVVTGLRDLHDQSVQRILQTLRQHMPGVPRLLAINKVRRHYTPSDVLAETRELTDQHDVGMVYAAYDFRGDKFPERLAPPPIEMPKPVDTIPVFFRLTPAAIKPWPQPINRENYLFHIGLHLERGQLIRDTIASLQTQLASNLETAVGLLDNTIEDHNQRAKRLQHSIACAVLGFSATRDVNGMICDVRLQASREIVQQVVASLESNTPWWAYPSLMVDRAVKGTKDLLASATKNLQLPNWGGSIRNIWTSWRQGQNGQVVTAENLRKELERYNVLSDLPKMDSDQLLFRCQTAFDRFQAENQTRLNPEQLDKWTAAVWSQMKFRKRVATTLLPLAPLVAPLAAVILIPLDFGGTAVLVFASLKELLAAAGIAGAVYLVSGSQLPAVAEQEAAWAQMSDLYAVVCDQLQVPRPAEKELPELSVGKSKRKLLPSQLVVRPQLHHGGSIDGSMDGSSDENTRPANKIDMMYQGIVTAQVAPSFRSKLRAWIDHLRSAPT